MITPPFDNRPHIIRQAPYTMPIGHRRIPEIVNRPYIVRKDLIGQTVHNRRQSLARLQSSHQPGEHIRPRDTVREMHPRGKGRSPAMGTVNISYPSRRLYTTPCPGINGAGPLPRAARWWRCRIEHIQGHPSTYHIVVRRIYKPVHLLPLRTNRSMPQLGKGPSLIDDLRLDTNLEPFVSVTDKPFPISPSRIFIRLVRSEIHALRPEMPESIEV